MKTKAIVTVTRPTLTPEEREKRMKKIKQATVELVTAYEIAKIKKERNTL